MSPGNPGTGLHAANLVKESAITVKYELLIIVHLGSLLCLCKKTGAEGCPGGRSDQPSCFAQTFLDLAHKVWYLGPTGLAEDFWQGQ